MFSKENKSLFGREYIQNDYVFKWDNGQPYNPDYITSKFAKTLKKYNLKKIRFHDLRHPYVKLTTKKFATFFENFRATA